MWIGWPIRPCDCANSSQLPKCPVAMMCFAAADAPAPQLLGLVAREADVLVDVARTQIVEERDLRGHPAEAAKGAAQDLAMPLRVLLREGAAQVVEPDVPQARRDQDAGADDARHERAGALHRQRAQPGEQRLDARVLAPRPQRRALLLVAAPRHRRRRHARLPGHAVASARAGRCGRDRRADPRELVAGCLHRPCHHHPSIADRRTSGYEQEVLHRTSQRRPRATFDRLLPALLLATSLVLSGCPVTPIVGQGDKGASRPRTRGRRRSSIRACSTAADARLAHASRPARSATRRTPRTSARFTPSPAARRRAQAAPGAGGSPPRGTLRP